ncbi:unnamed protein product [Allacma fusca]|uniref:Kynurenine 3-monooxygenase n=1 Tax=Allacma fusca TaxID=39272 RepID=A0A8J2JMF4_9HEXA|nr:unnamed protein product [Allacma fusca]
MTSEVVYNLLESPVSIIHSKTPMHLASHSVRVLDLTTCYVSRSPQLHSIVILPAPEFVWVDPTFLGQFGPSIILNYSTASLDPGNLRGGLVGALCACILGKKGHNIDVFEYRADPRSADEKLSRGKSINLALSTRGRATLARAGLEDLIISNGIPMKGRMLHSVTGQQKKVLYDPNGHQCIYSVSRRDLNNVLLTAAEKMPNVKLHFRHKLVSADPAKGKLQLQNREGHQESLIDFEANLLIGADGAHSAMRQQLLKRRRTNFSQTYIEHGYMELSMLPRPDGKHAMEKNYLHIWPRDQFMMIALPNQDGSFTVTLFMPFQNFDEISSPEDVKSFFRKEFPDALDLIGEELLISDFLSSSPSALISIKCSPLHAQRAVLIGDAAHAMVPFYGQGMNAGFEDVLILDDLLDNWDVHGIEKCLANFTETRREDAQAICELAMYNYTEMRHLVNQRGYYLRRLVDQVLNKVFGNGWVPLYNSVTFTRIPYSQCIQKRKWQDEILEKMKNVFVAGTAVALVGVALQYRSNIPFRIEYLGK